MIILIKFLFSVLLTWLSYLLLFLLLLSILPNIPTPTHFIRITSSRTRQALTHKSAPNRSLSLHIRIIDEISRIWEKLRICCRSLYISLFDLFWRVWAYLYTFLIPISAVCVDEFNTSRGISKSGGWFISQLDWLRLGTSILTPLLFPTESKIAV